MTTTPTGPAAFDWASVEPEYRRLLDQPLSPEMVPAWLSAWSDLEKTVQDVFVIANNRKNEDTANREAEETFLRLVRDVMPRRQVANQALKAKLLAVEGWTPGPEHERMIARFRNDADLFRDANVPIQAELAAMANEFNKITGARVVKLGDRELTFPEAQQRLLSTDRATREAAWRGMRASATADAAQLDELFTRMLALRRRLAENAGLPDYRAFRWRELNRLDYTPADTRAFQDAVEAEVAPLIHQARDARRRALGLDRLRPWDLGVDPHGREPLHPFSTVREYEDKLERTFAHLDPQFGARFASMRDGWLDLENRRSKVPGLGYNTTLPGLKKSYIYWSAVGTDRDVTVLLHEGGHAFHGFAAMEAQDLYWNAGSPIEFAEVASQSMELLALAHLGADGGGFYDQADLARWRASKFESILGELSQAAMGDAFQQWLYAEAGPDVTPADLDARWVALQERFQPGVDWSGLEAERAKGWQFVHIFTIPLYLVEYGLAWLGALQVWRHSLADPAAAIARYKAALALGNTRSLPALFEAAGARFTPDRETVAGLMRLVEGQLDEAP